VLSIKHKEIFKNSIKNIISASPRLHAVYGSYALSKQHRALFKKIGNSTVKQSLLDRRTVTQQIRQRKEKKRSKVCHIIGSGWSLNESLKEISPQDFVIGFNYAAISDLEFDAYFFEFGGQKVEEISNNHLDLARVKVKNQTDLIYFKNIWEGKNDTDFISSHWMGLARPVMDHLYVTLDKRHLNQTLASCLNDRSEYIPQICSTVVTAVILAYQAGFERIVIHGLDFGGQYFYECMEADIDPRFLPPPKPVSGFYGKTNKADVHPTAQATVGMRDIVPVLHDLLDQKGVEMMCGYEHSPSSAYLPVYRKN
tara:strand:+ start:2379 stop:3311 length:933 start_codon:yes stop_codon:yes gene_type:complete